MTESLKSLRELIKKAQDNPNDETALYIMRLAAGNSLLYLIEVAEAAQEFVEWPLSRASSPKGDRLRAALSKVQP